MLVRNRVGQKKLFFEIQKKGVLKSWKISYKHILNRFWTVGCNNSRATTWQRSWKGQI